MGLLKTLCGAFFSPLIYYFSRKRQIKNTHFCVLEKMCIQFLKIFPKIAIIRRCNIFLKNFPIFKNFTSIKER